jgi:hypothetical protein
MLTTKKGTASAEALFALESLQKAVTQALEKKKRLGQYSVMWKDGKPVISGEDAPTPPKSPK